MHYRISLPVMLFLARLSSTKLPSCCSIALSATAPSSSISVAVRFSTCNTIMWRLSHNTAQHRSRCQPYYCTMVCYNTCVVHSFTVRLFSAAPPCATALIPALPSGFSVRFNVAMSLASYDCMKLRSPAAASPLMPRFRSPIYAQRQPPSDARHSHQPLSALSSLHLPFL